MDFCPLPDTLSVNVQLAGTNDGPIVYKLPRKLIAPSDMVLDVAVVRIMAPHVRNMKGSKYYFQWHLEEEDIRQMKYTTTFPRHELDGYFKEPYDVWKAIINSDDAAFLATKVGGLNMRKGNVSISPRMLLEGTDEDGLFSLSNGPSIPFVTTQYSREHIRTLDMVLTMSPDLHMLLTGAAGSQILFDLSVDHKRSLIFPDELTRFPLLPLVYHIRMKGLDNGMVNGRLCDLLMTIRIGEQYKECSVVRYKRLNPQWEKGDYSCWDELEFCLEDDEGTKLIHDHGYLHLLLDLRWTRSGRMRFDTPLVRDVYRCMEGDPSRQVMKRMRLT
mgnify:CR=1 FL=1